MSFNIFKKKFLKILMMSAEIAFFLFCLRKCWCQHFLEFFFFKNILLPKIHLWSKFEKVSVNTLEDIPIWNFHDVITMTSFNRTFKISRVEYEVNFVNTQFWYLHHIPDLLSYNLSYLRPSPCCARIMAKTDTP